MAGPCAMPPLQAKSLRVPSGREAPAPPLLPVARSGFAGRLDRGTFIAPPAILARVRRDRQTKQIARAYSAPTAGAARAGMTAPGIGIRLSTRMAMAAAMKLAIAAM